MTEDELASIISMARRIDEGKEVRGSVTAIVVNLARALVALHDEAELAKKPKPITFAVSEGKKGLDP